MTKDPYKYFRIEARELLEGLGQGVLDLEQGSAGPDRIAGLLRLAHTLKGASRVVKQPAIAELAHSIESVLEPHRNGLSPVPKESVAELLRLADRIAISLATLESPAERGVAARGRPSYEDSFETVRVEVEEVDAVLENLAEASVRLNGIRQQAGGIERAKRLAQLLVEQANFLAGETNGALSPKARGLAEELSTSLDQLDRGLAVDIEQAERELAQTRDRADHLRLLPVGTIFPPLARAARDAAQSVGKRIEFESSGGDIRLDAQVLLVLRGALLHLVRNAVAHGIESEEVRTAAGKPAVGRVELRVERRGNHVAFICRDDGGGIDVDAIRSVAVTRGAISAAKSESFGLEQAIQLILAGGISTTAEATELSGRGIGLDVVRETAARLKGDVRIETAPSQGTTVQIRVRVSLTSVPVLMVESSGFVYSIPLESVRQTLLVADQEVARSGATKSITHDGRMIPFCSLLDALGLQNTPKARHRGSSTVLVASDQDLVAVGVDRMLGIGTVVLRTLPAVVAADPVVAGASLDAEGNPRLVLDPAGLVEAARRFQAPAKGATAGARFPILVIDDSLTTRMLEQSILESAGYVVEVASSAEEAIEKAKACRYGLFLVDVEMPGMDGFDFVARTRADSVLREVPAILVTSRNSDEDRRRGEEVGACAYIVKSEFDQAFLLQTIRQLVGQP